MRKRARVLARVLAQSDNGIKKLNSFVGMFVIGAPRKKVREINTLLCPFRIELFTLFFKANV